MRRVTASFAAVVAVAFLVVLVLGWQVARTRDLGKQNRALGRQNTDSIRRLQALQRQAIKACVGRHRIVVALTEVARVNARRSKGSPSVIRNWQRLGIGIRSADCNAEQLRRSQQLVGPQEPKVQVLVPKVRLVIRYRYRTRTRTVQVFVPVNRTVTVPGPATVRVETVTVTGPTVTGPTVTAPAKTVTVTVTVPPGKPPTTTATTTVPTTVTVPKPKPCKKPPCKP